MINITYSTVHWKGNSFKQNTNYADMHNLLGAEVLVWLWYEFLHQYTDFSGFQMLQINW